MKYTYFVFCLTACAAGSLVACGSVPRAPGQAETSNVSGDVDGQPTTLKYLLYLENPNATDPRQAYKLSFTDYDNCAWMQTHVAGTLPKDFSALTVYLDTGSAGAPAAPASNTDYTVGAPGGASANVVDSNASGFGIRTNCDTKWLAISNGTLHTTNIGGPLAGGNLSFTLTDGSTLSGSFTAGTCQTQGAWSVSSVMAGDGCADAAPNTQTGR